MRASLPPFMTASRTAGMKKNDRLFVFFAGHGATRQLSSGRDLGYIVPVDSDPNQIATDAIPMTELQNIAEGVTAKHALFVMDACYSGLGLTRGAGNSNYLRDNAKRVGRQMLTAGGADQLVADGGPNGHSVFTWALLQGLGGKGDLNGDGLITATELAAYVAPAVAATSRQTPAFGSLPGSEGGDFIFELPSETEFLSGETKQLPSEAIALNTKLDAARPRARGTGRGRQAGGSGTGRGEGLARRRTEDHAARRGADLATATRPARQRPRPAVVPGKAIRRGGGAVHGSPETQA